MSETAEAQQINYCSSHLDKHQLVFDNTLKTLYYSQQYLRVSYQLVRGWPLQSLYDLMHFIVYLVTRTWLIQNKRKKKKNWYPVALYFTFSSSISYIYKDTWMLMRLVHQFQQMRKLSFLVHQLFGKRMCLLYHCTSVPSFSSLFIICQQLRIESGYTKFISGTEDIHYIWTALVPLH